MADVTIRFKGDTTDIDRDIRGIKGAATGAATAIKAAVGAAAAAGVAKFATSAITSFSNLEESVNAVNVQFGAGAQTVRDFGETAAESVGLSESAFNQLSVTTGAVLGSFITDEREAAEATIDLTRRAADMASVFNTDVNDALIAVQAAVRGESEPIRRFGVQLDDASVKARAVALGLAETTAEVDLQAKGMARLDLIYEQTNKTAGDFENTSDSLANRQKVLAAEFENVKAKLGAGLVPVFEVFLGLLEKSIPLMTSAATGTSDLVSGIEESALRLATFFGSLPGEYAEIEATSRSLRRELEAGTPTVEALALAYADVADKSDLTRRGIFNLADEIGASGVETQNAIQWALDHRDALDLDTQAVLSLIYQLSRFKAEVSQLGGDDETQRLITRFGNVAGAIDGATSATSEFADSQRKLVDPLFALKDAQEKVKTAEDKVTQLRVDGKENTKEYTDASTDLVEAVGDLQYAESVYNDNADEIIANFAAIAENAGFADEMIRRMTRSIETAGSTPFSPGGDPFGVGGGGGPGSPGGGVLEGVDFQQPSPTFNIEIDARGNSDPEGIAREIVREQARELDLYNAGQRRP